jgi:hypothetical protein
MNKCEEIEKQADQHEQINAEPIKAQSHSEHSWIEANEDLSPFG